MLPNAVTYDTLDLIEDGFYDNTAVYLVPGSLLRVDAVEKVFLGDCLGLHRG